MRDSREQREYSHDLIILSDLHLGAGYNPVTRKYFHLENFFYDHTFFDFIEHFLAEADATGRRFRLILNGDFIDFLRIDFIGSAPARYGRLPEEPKPLLKLAAAQCGHVGFFKALARWIAAGHDLVVLPGNHDPEWSLPEIRTSFHKEMAWLVDELRPEQGKALVKEHLDIRPWFYYEPGRIWVEHGSQYDPANSLGHPLALWDGGGGGEGLRADRLGVWRLAEPLGSFFQRHLYSWLGNVTFVVPSVRADAAYVRWLLFNRPRQLARLVLWHLPFLWRIWRSYKGWDPKALRQAEEAHARTLQQQAVEYGLEGKLEEIDRLKVAPQDHKFRVIRRLFTIGGGSLAAIFVGLLGLLGMWYTAFLWVAESRLPLLLRGLIFGGTNLLLILVVFGISGLWLLRSDGTAASGDVIRLRRRALKIARIVQVPIVTFGHTHAEDIVVAAQSTYFNTGTWIPTFTGEDLRLRDQVSFPFLLVCGTEVEFLRWDHMLGRAVRFSMLEADPWRPDYMPYDEDR